MCDACFAIKGECPACREDRIVIERDTLRETLNDLFKVSTVPLHHPLMVRVKSVLDNTKPKEGK